MNVKTTPTHADIIEQASKAVEDEVKCAYEHGLKGLPFGALPSLSLKSTPEELNIMAAELSLSTYGQVDSPAFQKFLINFTRIVLKEYLRGLADRSEKGGAA